MISGAHVLLFSSDPEADRAFFRDVLGFPSVDAGHGWLIFALPPAEVAIHPTNGPASADAAPAPAGQGQLDASLYLLCDDLEALIRSLAAKGVRCTEPARERWGLRTAIPLPSGGAIGLYQPTHPTAHDLGAR